MTRNDWVNIAKMLAVNTPLTLGDHSRETIICSVIGVLESVEGTPGFEDIDFDPEEFMTLSEVS